MELRDDEPSTKKFQQSVAELSRPHRAYREKEREANRKPQGRKRKNVPRPAKYKNWHTPFCWSQILIATKRTRWQMSAKQITKELKKMDPIIFETISPNTIDSWIDRSGEKPRWKDSVLQKMENLSGNSPGHNKGGRQGILVCRQNCHQFQRCLKNIRQTRYPDVTEAIKMRLTDLRKHGSAVTLITACATIIATILHLRREIFDHTFKDGSQFRASESFVRKFLHGTLSWSIR